MRQKNSRMNVYNESKQSSEGYLYEQIHVARKLYGLSHLTQLQSQQSYGSSKNL